MQCCLTLMYLLVLFSLCISLLSYTGALRVAAVTSDSRGS